VTGPEITPAPEPEEVAAILAAYEALWPKPVALADASLGGEVQRWRFSGRWWSKPAPLRREIPAGYR
jgi:hypothetical protein